MTLKIGVIGTGMIGRDHTRRIQQVLAGAEVVALSDVNAASAEAVRKDLAPNTKLYDTGEALIAAPEVQAVLVTSWGATHEPYVLAAIAAGKPVFCEKPLATTAEGARRIVDAEVKFGKRLVQVGFMRRYDAGYVALKHAVENHTGAPILVHAAHRNPAVPEAYVTPMAIHDTMIHEIDVFRWLLNDDYVSARVLYPRNAARSHTKLRDPQVVVLETQKGVLINVEIFVNCAYGYDIQCEVVGEEGTAKLPEPMTVDMRLGAKRQSTILTDWKDRFVASYDVELKDFIGAASQGGATGPSAWDGYAAAVTSDACVQAQESNGQPVAIELPTRPALYA
ncbi:MAG: inositol 2-dehydrogenase [Curvibacter sp. RIFCSPHIGHO2_12_FULL_63_18]|uniref:Gfo/Idh/MocA family oxidoreductase n=1 Tax=Rhodoferax sp. TaxID=50421 RepID=UPI0008D47058|nr:Gfo/Idh/MocA family oxidoreductase [Rhodoferax sp.]OGO99534.1 MAG: inositol 2-dehydrogenase [Curvibacter sp. GWA2_63_95]OGP04582.1 MAG: inositol 2-dehydrogenase [Curvibacter sp. RIFCSPHIGHO2_12_FULL_63_18]HCX80932.1 inositol 2-dehydrogenase [Rhodoferax sp.]